MKRTTTNLFWPFLSFFLLFASKKERKKGGWVGCVLLLPQSSVEKFTFFFRGQQKKIREESNHPMRSLRCKRQRVWGSLGRKKKRKKKKKKNINVVVKEIDRYKGNCRGHETPNTWLPGLPHSCSKFPQTPPPPKPPKIIQIENCFFLFLR
jgi:hypothetical protein